VGMEPVITHADSQTDSNPVEYGCRHKALPGEHKQGRDGAEVQKRQHSHVEPVQSFEFGRRRVDLLLGKCGHN
jgi:hypothetical protein